VARSVGKALAELRRQTSDIVEDLQLQTMLGDDQPRRPASSTAKTAASEKPAAPEKPDEPPTPRPNPSQGA
jgi:Sec-independent protein translocase protein TatA